MNYTQVGPIRKAPALAAPQQGSVLLIMAIMVFMFLGASMVLATAQVSQSSSLGATYGKMQATYAAETGVYASFDATQALPVTEIWHDGTNLATFETTLSAASPPMWIDSTGSFTYGGFTYHSRARGYAMGGKVLQWLFN